MYITGKKINIGIETAEVDGKAIILHSTMKELSDILEEKYGLEYKYETVFCNGTTTAFKCSASATVNGKVIRAEEFGEANSKNLTNDIAMKYPVIMASKRAFDRAIIRLCGFNAYSDCEISVPKEVRASCDGGVTVPVDVDPETGEVKEAPTPKKTKKTPTKAKAEAPVAETVKTTVEETTPLPAPAVETIVDEEPYNPWVVSADDDEEDADFFDSLTPIAESAVEAEEVATPAEEEPVEEVAVATEPEEEGEKPEFLSFKVSLGRYRSKGVTMEQLFRIDRDSLEWLANTKRIEENWSNHRDAANATLDYFAKKGKEIA